MLDHAVFAEAAMTSTFMTQASSSQAQMFPKQWAEEDGLGRNLKQHKPEPLKKKKKTICDKETDEREASAQGETQRFDTEQAEEQWLESKMQDHIGLLKEESKFLNGKRYGQDGMPQRNIDEQSRFWLDLTAPKPPTPALCVTGKKKTPPKAGS